jgi:hypothetical protein
MGQGSKNLIDAGTGGGSRENTAAPDISVFLDEAGDVLTSLQKMSEIADKIAEAGKVAANDIITKRDAALGDMKTHVKNAATAQKKAEDAATDAKLAASRAESAAGRSSGGADNPNFQERWMLEP